MRPWAISALTSLGRQLPPNPHPALRKAVIAGSRSSVCSAKILAQVNPSHHLGRVDTADLRSEVGNLIRERDQSREQSVGCVLNHLRGSRVGTQARHACRQRRVESLQNVRRSFIDSTEYEAVRKQEVVDGRAFGEKLGIHAQSKICPAPLAGCSIQYGPHHFVGRARHYRALDHDHMVFIDLGKRRAYLACRLADIADIDTLPVERRADCDERHLAAADRRAQVGGCAQPVSDMSLQEFLKAGLEDRTLAPLKSLDSSSCPRLRR